MTNFINILECSSAHPFLLGVLVVFEAKLISESATDLAGETVSKASPGSSLGSGLLRSGSVLLGVRHMLIDFLGLLQGDLVVFCLVGDFSDKAHFLGDFRSDGLTSEFLH